MCCINKNNKICYTCLLKGINDKNYYKQSNKFYIWLNKQQPTSKLDRVNINKTVSDNKKN